MRTFLIPLVSLAVAVAAAGCASVVPAGKVSTGASPSQADAFFARLTSLCGQSFGGQLAQFNEADRAAFGGAAVMHVRDCSADVIRIPFHVGENRSRTWVITRIGDRLRLKHDHRHEDGSSDALTMYGGETTSRDAGSAMRQEFPADDESKALFSAAGLEVSNANVWAIEVDPGRLFAYELRRPNRHFRVEFDLSKPLPTPPPPPWGS